MTQALERGTQAAGSGGRLALTVGLVTALVALTTSMAQLERAANRIYGIQRATGRATRSTCAPACSPSPPASRRCSGSADPEAGPGADRRSVVVITPEAPTDNAATPVRIGPPR